MLSVFSVIGQLGLCQLGAKTLQHLSYVFDGYSKTLNSLKITKTLIISNKVYNETDKRKPPDNLPSCFWLTVRKNIQSLWQ